MNSVEGKVLLQINSCVTKSTGRIVQQIGDLFVESGGISYIAYSPREQSCNCKSILLPFGSKLSVYFHAIESLLLDRHGLGSRSATLCLIKKIDKIKPDIIHIHNIHGYYINYKILFSYLASYNKPVIWTLHDCWIMTGHCSHFDNIGCIRWKDGCYSCPLSKSYPKSIFIDKSSENYKIKKHYFSMLDNLTIVCVSDWLRSIVSQSFMQKYQNLTINNGIDLNVFKCTKSELREKLGISDNKFILLGIGTNWSNDKGLKEFSKLSKEKNFQIILVGINKEIKSTLPESIISIGRTNNQTELAQYYSLADVLVNPTYNDSFPTINIESIACGTPVVTYKTGGSPEIIDSKTGVVVPKGDYQALLRAIKEVESKGKSFYTENCRNRALGLFNKEERYRDYIRLYVEIMGNENKGISNDNT